MCCFSTWFYTGELSPSPGLPPGLPQLPSIVEFHPDSVIPPLSVFLEVSESFSVLTMFVLVFCPGNTLTDFETSRSMRLLLMNLSESLHASLVGW